MEVIAKPSSQRGEIPSRKRPFEDPEQYDCVCLSFCLMYVWYVCMYVWYIGMVWYGMYGMSVLSSQQTTEEKASVCNIDM